MFRKGIGIAGVIFIIIIIIFNLNENSNSFTSKTVFYNGNNLKISVDGESVNSLPTSGNYYLVDYDCQSSNTVLSWDKSTYQLTVTNKNKKGGVSCYLDFQSNPKLADMKPGSYVQYTGTNGCTGESCNGQNANYVSDTDMGYCNDSYYRFITNGWRVGYIKDGSAYLVAAGSTDCMCTASDGTMSSSSCSGSLSSTDLYKHFDNLNQIALKYCNQDFVYGGVCDSNSTWAMNAGDFQNITGKALSSSSCYGVSSDKSCGYTKDLIDNGGYYWYATPYGSTSATTFIWIPGIRSVSNDYSRIGYGARAVLRLESSVLVVGGSGTYEDPYQISNNSFRINDGAEYVGSSGKNAVQLSLIGNNVASMCISVDTSGCSNYIDFATSYTLDWSSEVDGEKVVYVYYKDSSGKIVSSMNRSIILDTTPPSNNSITIGDGTGLTRTLTISSTSADYMCFSNTSSNVSDCTNWVDYATSYSWSLTGGEGEKTVYAFFKDEVGNIGSIASDTITFTTSCLGVGEVYGIDYSGTVVTSGDADVNFCAGTYKLQVWGAQGGNTGGKGGYSVGEITLNGTETVYFYVGGAGGTGSSAGFNGGGTTGSSSGAGGGATDVRINNNSLYARVIVAGGGGGKGQDTCAYGAVGGGTSGGGGASQDNCGTQAGGGTQTAGGAVGVYSSTNGANAGTFGVGGNASDSSYDGGGGGGGWYGGGAGASAGWSNGGGGGSGFVYTSSTASNVPSGWLLNSTYYLSNASTIDGAQSTIPTTDGSGTETGHSSNGYLKITRLS